MMNDILLNEVYDFEFRARWSSGTRFILNSAWQGKLDVSQNQVNTKYLRRKMREELNLEVLSITGKYAESLEPVECMVSFPPDDVDNEMLKRFFYYYGRRFQQNAIIFVDENDIIWTLPTRPSSTFGTIGRFIRGPKFVIQHFHSLLLQFMHLTYEMDRVKIPTN